MIAIVDLYPLLQCDMESLSVESLVEHKTVSAVILCSQVTKHNKQNTY